MVEAESAVAEARADCDRVYAGVREEQVAILAREIEKAQATPKQAEQEFQRVAALAANDNASQARLDEVTSDVAGAKAELALQEAAHAEAAASPTAEERALKNAAVLQAEAAHLVLRRRLQKATLRAPADGRVAVLVTGPGEAVDAGKTVLTLEPEERYFTFNLREDRLHGIEVGSEVALRIPGDGRIVRARVTETRAARRLRDLARGARS